MLTESTLLADGTKQIMISKKQFAEINSALEQFSQRSKCLSIILADSSGLLIARSGSMSPNNLPVLSALAAADYAATKEMAKIIGEQTGFKTQFHEGHQSNLFVNAVNSDYFLVIVFSKEITFGMIRVLSSKTSEELNKILSQPNEENQTTEQQNALVKNAVNDQAFQDELSLQLSNVLITRTNR